jgi:hypothetical protein
VHRSRAGDPTGPHRPFLAWTVRDRRGPGMRRGAAARWRAGASRSKNVMAMTARDRAPRPGSRVPGREASSSGTCGWTGSNRGGPHERRHGGRGEGAGGGGRPDAEQGAMPDDGAAVTLVMGFMCFLQPERKRPRSLNGRRLGGHVGRDERRAGCLTTGSRTD